MDTGYGHKIIDYLCNSLIKLLLIFGRFHGSVIIPMGAKEIGRLMYDFCRGFTFHIKHI